MKGAVRTQLSSALLDGLAAESAERVKTTDGAKAQENLIIVSGGNVFDFSRADGATFSDAEAAEFADAAKKMVADLAAESLKGSKP